MQQIFVAFAASNQVIFISLEISGLWVLITVFEQGPARAADTQGEGFGGGASYKDNEGETLGVGLPGVILMEIGP